MRARLTNGDVVDLSDCDWLNHDQWWKRRNKEYFLRMFPAMGGIPGFDPKLTAWERMKRIEIASMAFAQEEQARLHEKARQMRAHGIVELLRE